MGRIIYKFSSKALRNLFSADEYYYCCINFLRLTVISFKKAKDQLHEQIVRKHCLECQEGKRHSDECKSCDL